MTPHHHVRAAAAAAGLLLLMAAGQTTAAATTGSATTQPATVVAVTCSAGAPAGTPSSVDGDFTPDLVVGVPGRNQLDLNLSGAGHVTLTEAQTSLGDLGPDAAGEFGEVVTTGDLNADGCLDVVVGAPHGGSSVGTGAPLSGAFDIIYGRAGQVPHDAVRVTGHDYGLELGSALAVDQRYPAGSTATNHPSDLWVGAPGYRVGNQAGAGAVLHYVVTPGNSTPALADVIVAPGTPAYSDHFGQSLDVGVLPGTDNLVLGVGSPGHDVDGAYNIGAVTFFTVDATTGAVGPGRTLTQDSPGIPGVAEANDRFGQTIALAKTALGGTVPGAVGVPYEDNGSLRDAGLVQTFTFDSAGVPTPGAAITQDSVGVPGVAEAGDRFGWSLLVDASPGGSRSGPLGLWVGSPTEDVGSVVDAGMVQWLPIPHTSSAGVRPVTLTQGTGGLGGRAETSDLAGWTLSSRPPLGLNTATFGTYPPTPWIGIPGQAGRSASRAGIVTNYSAHPAQVHNYGYSGGAVQGLLFGESLASADGSQN